MAVDVLLSLAVLILSAKLFSEVAERLKIAPLAGEVFGGIVVGSLHLVAPSATLQEIATIGILFMFFIIGLNMRPERSELRGGITLALAGALLSFVLGFAIGLSFSLAAALVIGAALLSTSSLVAMNSLTSMGEYRTKVYKLISSAELADGFAAILAISLLSAFLAGNVQISQVIVLSAGLLAVMLFALTAGSRLADRFLSLFHFVKDEQIFVAIPLVVVFLAAFLSEQLGLAGFAGAFLAGLAMRKFSLTESTIMPKIKTIGYGFFVPLFFAYAALSFDFSALSGVYWLVVLLFAAGLAGKFLGYGVLGSFFGFKGRDRKILSLAMLPRGEYSILIAQLALGFAVISGAVYSALLAFVLLSVIATPLLLRIFGK